jgi:hypothetical protein
MSELFALSGAIPPQPRVTRNTPYEVCVYRTRTGEVVKWLPIVGVPRWERGLNIVGSWSVRVSLDQSLLTKDELSRLIEPWHWSWAIVQGRSIHQAGPVLSEDFADDGSQHTTISGVGLWALYKEKRVLYNKDVYVIPVLQGIDADVAFGPGTTSDKGGPIPLANRDLSLHTIVKRLLENEQGKGGGAVPLVLPDDVPGDSARTFLGAELATTGNRIYEITQVRNGPEVEFVPQFTDTERTGIEHQVYIGNPRLGQLGYEHSWTYGKALTKLGFISDGSRMVNRRWDRGSGFERNVQTGFFEDDDGVTAGIPVSWQTMPLLETVGQEHTDNGNPVELIDYARADVERGLSSELNLAAEVTLEGDSGDGSDPPSPTFDSVSPGDTASFHVYGHPRLRDGRYQVRILRMSASSSYKRGVLTVEVLGRP